MSLFCRILGHAAMDVHYRNQGIDFCICARCAEDLIRREGEDWQPLPKGTRVVWSHSQSGCDSAAVAMRMQAPPPRRRLPRTPGAGGYDMRQRVVVHRERRAGGGPGLIGLCGRMVLAGIADSWRASRAGRPAIAKPIYLPRAPRAKRKPSSGPRNYRAWWLMHNAPPARIARRHG